MTVSIVIPTYNREATIAKAVDCVLAQSHRDIEVIIVDDGSVDSTLEVLATYGERISIIRQANAGPSAARNRGVKSSKGEIIAFLDSDDQWAPTKIERQVALMQRGGSGMSCCVCNATVMDGRGVLLGKSFDFAGLSVEFDEGEWLNPQVVLATRFLLFNQVVAIRRDAFERVGGYNENLRLLEDYEISIRLSTVGKWGVIRDALVMKYNDPDGLGVSCMTNREHHASIRSSVLSEILARGNGLTKPVRNLLVRQLADSIFEKDALEMVKSANTLKSSLGRAQLGFLKIRKGLRRRMPGWPSFQGRPC